MATLSVRKVELRKLLKLYTISLMAAVMVVSVAAESVLALRAPTQVGSDIPYYYVSDGISDNGRFPFTYVGFYWNSDSGSRTIRYDPRKCNNGGYDDSSDGDPRVTIYGINANGTMNAGNILVNTTHINACHDNNGDTSFSFDLANTLRDTNINMKGVVVRVDSNGDGDSRAWFSLETPDIDGVDFGVMGGRPVGYSRDFWSDGGGYYSLQTGFGSCSAAAVNNQVVEFFDTDSTKYQSNGSGDDNALRIQFQNLTDGTTIRNDSTIIHDRIRISLRSGTTTQFNVNANTGQSASLEFNMAANKGYRLNIQHLREGNDITVEVPTNEIYGKRACPPPPSIWTMSGYTTVSSSTAAPGQQVTFTHHVVNNGPNTTNQNIWSDTQVSGGVGTAKGGHDGGLYTNGQNKTTDTDTITIPSGAVSGQQYCQRVGYQATAHNNSAYSSGAWTCVTVQLGYNLTPVVTTSPGAIVRVAQDFSFSYSVRNNTAYTTNRVDWTIRQTVTTPAGVTTGSVIESGTRLSSSGNWSPRADDHITNTYPVGSRVCRYLWINSSTAAPNVPREQGTCVLIAAAPYAAAVGGNIWSGGSTVAVGGIYGGIASIRGVVPVNFGSFGEYGLFATGTIGYFGSAGQLGGSSTTKGAVDGARLTFASENVPSLPTLGNFSTSHKITNWTSLCPGGLINTVNLGAGVPLVLGAGTHQIVCANVVNIRGNITYNTAGATTFGQLPSLTVIANTIQIEGSVAEIAGNFYAANAFVTCNEGPRVASSSATITTSGVCSAQRLTVNGAVTIANQAVNSLVLNRGIGGNAPGQAAEIIRMRPEVFLTPFENSSSLLTTVQETELPARY